MKDTEQKEGVHKDVTCRKCGEPMTWKIGNVSGKFAWHCKNIKCTEYNS